MTRSSKVVEVESVGIPEPENDTRFKAQEADVSVEVNGEDQAVEETPATDVPDVSVPSQPSDDKAVDEDEAVSAEDNAHTDEAPEALSDKVMFADTGLNVHILMNPKPMVDERTGTKYYDVKGAVLAPGDSVSVNELPPYVIEDLNAGKIPGARLVSSEEAFRLNREAAHIRALADQTVGVESNAITEIVSPVG